MSNGPWPAGSHHLSVLQLVAAALGVEHTDIPSLCLLGMLSEAAHGALRNGGLAEKMGALPHASPGAASGGAVSGAELHNKFVHEGSAEKAFTLSTAT